MIEVAMVKRREHRDAEGRRGDVSSSRERFGVRQSLPLLVWWDYSKAVRSTALQDAVATNRLGEPGCWRTAGDSRPYLRLAKREAPKGRHAIARGVSPGSATRKHTSPERAAQTERVNSKAATRPLIRPLATFSPAGEKELSVPSILVSSEFQFPLFSAALSVSVFSALNRMTL